ncbi:helix-turn-helix domain-containing protein [Agrobacterium vitis]|uniref:helix-turn-helix domain-containing protein n=1 Tax=Agrobacterium vitis TaxID=373 RepID=UPI001F43E1A2|nr:helix-turn-helix transcriptional regulator [Agrobacterium vitis]MCF1453431.1 helix-turn-helix transcriptional regulator [Agrobacterium vitis]
MKRPGRPAKPKPEKPRAHYVVEWAQLRGLSQADIIRELDGDPGTVSRWFGGTLPTAANLEKLATLFKTDIPGLFHHPADDKLLKSVAALSPEQRLALAEALQGVDGVDASNVEQVIRVISAFKPVAAPV